MLQFNGHQTILFWVAVSMFPFPIEAFVTNFDYFVNKNFTMGDELLNRAYQTLLIQRIGCGFVYLDCGGFGFLMS